MSIAEQAPGIAGGNQTSGTAKSLVSMGRLIAGLWVLLRDEDDLTEREVSRLERENLAAMGPVPFDLHVVPLTAVDEANLPPFETILQR